MLPENENSSKQLPQLTLDSDEEELCPTRVRSETPDSGMEQWWAPPQTSRGSGVRNVVPWTPPPVAPSGDPLLGAEIGSFRLMRKLGGGGMGTVYLGEHMLIGSKVAVKFLHDHFASDEALIQRFLAEARVVNLIGHENIINIFDMNVLPPRRHFLIMEYLEGSPLSAMKGQQVALPVAVSILSQVCDALQAAHAHGVVHRDLKPENIFLVRHDRMPHFVKVLDFGIAKLMDSMPQQGQTSAGTLIGTPEYMAPEQWYGNTLDGRTDLYALGMIAYELLVGRPAFSKGGLGNLLHAHLMECPPSPHELRPEVPVALSDAVMRAMAKRPEERYRDAAEMREALEQALPPQDSRPRGALATPVPTPTPASPSEAVRMSLPTTPASLPPPVSPVPSAGELAARICLQPGSPPIRLACTDLARGGVFLCTDGTLPPLRSRVSLTLELHGRSVPCMAEVVHHVPAALASTWKMRPGFAVQFLELSEEARAVLASLGQGRGQGLEAPKAQQDDAQAELMLRMLFRRMKSDPYALLCLKLDATFEDVRKYARSTLRYLETIAARPLSPRQQQDLAEMRSLVEKAAEVLGHARQRVEHDAWRSNYTGVARCISSGVSATELEALQARFLVDHPGAEAIEQVHAHTAKAWEGQGRIDLALSEYERALRANPLRLSLQQRYWTLKQRGVKPTPPPEPLSGDDVSGLWQRSDPS
ncbi:serine/threonine protein kinase [Hyalangium gracile]|uniref:serine/threonine protein kinase n=1 Tax=Hyalangium gracile TaxID=394092 RepID=UPI001CC9AAE6|nr:serine/threonine-protein kinase [Hyalangium gracile]